MRPHLPSDYRHHWPLQQHPRGRGLLLRSPEFEPAHVHQFLYSRGVPRKTRQWQEIQRLEAKQQSGQQDPQVQTLELGPCQRSHAPVRHPVVAVVPEAREPPDA